MIKRSVRKMSYSRLLFFLGVGVAWYSNLPQRYLASRYAYKVESFLLRKEYTKAQKMVRKALRESPRSIYALRALANLHLAKGANQKALVLLSRVLKRVPQFHMARFDRGRARFKLKDYDGALVDFRLFLKRSPADGYLLTHLGRVYLVQKKYSLAVATFTRAIQLSPKYIVAYRWRALARFQLGLYERATEDGYRFLRLSPFDLGVNIMMAKAFLGLRDDKSVIFHCKLILRKNPQHDWALSMRQSMELRLWEKKSLEKLKRIQQQQKTKSLRRK